MEKLVLLAALLSLGVGCYVPGKEDDDDDNDEEDWDPCPPGFERDGNGDCQPVGDGDETVTETYWDDTPTTTEETWSTTRDTTEPEPDTASGPGAGWNADYMLITIQFGWDAAQQQLVDFTWDGVTYAPAIQYHIGNSGWDFSLSSTDDFCTVTVPLTNAVVDSSVAADPVLWWGFDLAPAQGATDDCAGEIDPSDPYANPAPMFDAASHTVHVGELDPYLESLLQNYMTADEVAQFFGNTFTSDIVGTTSEYFYLQAFGVDAGFNVVLDGAGDPAPWDAVDVPTAQGIRTAAYTGGIVLLYSL